MSRSPWCSVVASSTRITRHRSNPPGRVVHDPNHSATNPQARHHLAARARPRRVTGPTIIDYAATGFEPPPRCRWWAGGNRWSRRRRRHPARGPFGRSAPAASGAAIEDAGFEILALPLKLLRCEGRWRLRLDRVQRTLLPGESIRPRWPSPPIRVRRDNRTHDKEQPMTTTPDILPAPASHGESPSRSTIVEEGDQPDATEMIRRLVAAQDAVIHTAKSIFPGCGAGTRRTHRRPPHPAHPGTREGGLDAPQLPCLTEPAPHPRPGRNP